MLLLPQKRVSKSKEVTKKTVADVDSHAAIGKHLALAGIPEENGDA